MEKLRAPELRAPELWGPNRRGPDRRFAETGWRSGPRGRNRRGAQIAPLPEAGWRSGPIFDGLVSKKGIVLQLQAVNRLLLSKMHKHLSIDIKGRVEKMEI